jgi:periplasmic divalent cation tolerance protein
MDVQLVYATFPDRESAEDLGARMLEERLAACFTCWEAGSVYRWEGEVVEDEETLALFKTSPDQRQALVAALEDEHPYDVPCVLPLASEAGPQAYADWVDEETLGVP